MKAIDFNNRFEATLKSHNLTYTVEQEVKDIPELKLKFEYKTFKINTRQPNLEGPVRVTLIKNTRGVRLGRLHRSSCSCFVVKSVFGQRMSTERGLRAVWCWIHVMCMPL